MMASPLARWIAIGAWTALVSLSHLPCAAQARLLSPGTQQEQQQEQKQQPPPAAALVFTTPANGSRVDGPDVHLHYEFFSTDSPGRELSTDEVKELSVTHSMCFELHGFKDTSEICAPLRVAMVTIKDALPAKWHTVTATLKNTLTAEVWGKSEVTVFNALNGFDELDMCGKSACLDSSDLRSAYFDYIYRHPAWDGDAASKSYNAPPPLSIQDALSEVFWAYDITSMLDAPCGELTWMHQVPGIENVLYTGADIAAVAVEDNRRNFDIQLNAEQEGAGSDVAAAATATTAWRLRDPEFVQADLVEALPASQDGKPFDLVFVRDLMLHLPARHNLRVLENIQASGARFLMASTFMEADENHLSETFVPPEGHNINLSLPPYCLPAPIALYEDESADRSDLRMGLWDLHQDKPLALGGDCSPFTQSA